MRIVVEAFGAEGWEDDFWDCGGEGVAFVGGVFAEEAEGGGGEVDGEGVVGGRDCEVLVLVLVLVGGGGGGDYPIEGCHGVGRGCGVVYGGFAFPARGGGGAVCGCAVEEGFKGVGTGGEGACGWGGGGGGGG